MLPLKAISWLALSAVLLAGCATGSSVSLAKPGRLTGSASIPWGEIESILAPKQRSTLESLKPASYVVMDGWIAEDGSVKISRATESYPDHAHDRLALAFGRKAVIHTTTSASKINPSAIIYVVFYADTIEGDIALTFAKRLGYVGEGHFGDEYYLNVVTY